MTENALFTPAEAGIEPDLQLTLLPRTKHKYSSVYPVVDRRRPGIWLGVVWPSHRAFREQYPNEPHYNFTSWVDPNVGNRSHRVASKKAATELAFSDIRRCYREGTATK